MVRIFIIIILCFLGGQLYGQKLKNGQFGDKNNQLIVTKGSDNRQTFEDADSFIVMDQLNDTTMSLSLGGVEVAHLQVLFSQDLNHILTGGSQQLSLTGNVLGLTNGSSVDFGPLLANISDDQIITDLSLSGNVLNISIEDGNNKTVDLSGIVTANTDDQLISQFAIVGNILSIAIEDGNTLSVDLSPYLDNIDTDDQTGDEVSINTTNFGGNLTLNANTIQKVAQEVNDGVFAGPQGDKGDKGDKGDAGVGISSVDENGNGTFTLNFTDNSSFTTIDLTGDKGDKGDQGISVSSVTNPSAGVFRFNLSNSTFYETPNITGPQGIAGVGISSVVSQGSGVLRINFTDNSFYDTPSFTGPQGAAGIDGVDGNNGTDGSDGISLTPQAAVTNVGDLPTTGNEIGHTRTVTADNHIYGWSGSTWFYMGIAGATGPAGADGNGISSTVNNNNGTYTFHYTNGSSFTTGNLTGPQGDPATNTDNQLLGDVTASGLNRTISLEDGGAKTFSVANYLNWDGSNLSIGSSGQSSLDLSSSLHPTQGLLFGGSGSIWDLKITGDAGQSTDVKFNIPTSNNALQASLTGFNQLNLSVSKAAIEAFGFSTTDNVNDGDSNPTNELQTITKVGSTVTLNQNGGSFTDEVNDADNVVGNEFSYLNLLATGELQITNNQTGNSSVYFNSAKIPAGAFDGKLNGKTTVESALQEIDNFAFITSPNDADFVIGNEYPLAGNNTTITNNREVNVDLSPYALSSSIPTNNNQLTNGAGYITGFTEVDGSTTNELQYFTLNGTTLSLGSTGNASVDLATIRDGYNSAYDTEAEIDAAVSNNGYLTSEVDGSITNETPIAGTNISVTGRTVGVVDNPIFDNIRLDTTVGIAQGAFCNNRTLGSNLAGEYFLCVSGQWRKITYTN